MRIDETSEGQQVEGAQLIASNEQAETSLETHRIYRVGMAYGRLVYRFRWFVLVFWLIALAVSLPFASKLPGILSGGGYSFSGSESIHVANLLTDKLHRPPSQLIVVFQSPDTSVSDPSYQKEVNDFAERARSFPHVMSITPGGVGQDGRTTFLVVSFNKDYDFMQQYVADFRALVSKGSSAGPAHAYLTDQLAVSDELNRTTLQDTERADATVLPIALLILVIVFGTFTAAIMPPLLALVAVPIALAIVYPIAQHTAISIFVLSVASIVGLGISIDYSLSHHTSTRQFFAEAARGRVVREAIAWTVATAGEAILFSGLTVIIGFTGLLLIGIGLMTSEGLGGAAVVAVAVLAALTLLPALLSVMGSRINALRIPWLWRLTMPAARTKNGAEEETGFWHRLAMGVMRRPVMVIILVSALLLVLGWPVFSLNIGTASSAILPASSEARQGLNILQAQYPAFNTTPVDIVAQTADSSNMLSAENLNRVTRLTQWLASQSHVTGVVSLTSPPATQGGPAISQQELLMLYTSGAYKQIPALAQFVSSTTVGGMTLISVSTDTKLDSDAGKALIDHLRAGDKAAVEGLTVQVGGIQAIYLDFDRYLYSNFPKAILFIVVATFVLLLLMFHSLLLPLKAILMNVLSVSAAYGVLVYVFQWGNFSNILGFTSNGFVDSLIPILLFCILFGLSMDYEVFLLSRIREEWLRTHNNTLAVARGLERTRAV